jgi:hypothetical protein
MAWEAIKEMIPPTLIRILVEKLVAMIVPAAGALMVIIEGLQAAWGTVSRIIAAIDTFIAFLKAVKGGGAGPQFAQALVAAMIVVLDFVANYLLMKLGSGLKALAGKLKGIARHLMKKKRAAKAKGKRRARAPSRRPRAPRRSSAVPRTQRRGRRREEQRRRKGELSPDAIVRTVASSLSRSPRSSDPREVIAEKRRQAAALRARYQPKAPRGRRLKIRLDESVAGIERDQALDFRVGMSPEVTGKSLVKPQRVTADIVGIRWGSKSRPSFRKATKEALAKKFPDAHVKGTTKLVANDKGQALYNRIHIVAFALVRRDYHSAIHGRLMPEAARFLKKKGHAPSAHQDTAVEAAAKRALTDEFNNLRNLSIGPSDANQEGGRKLGEALRKQADAEKRGDVDAANRHARDVAEAGVDAPQKLEAGAQGKPLSTRAKKAIEGVDDAVATLDRLEGDLPSAAAALRRVRLAIRVLSRESQVVQRRSLGRVSETLKTAVEVQLRLGRIVGNSNGGAV